MRRLGLATLIAAGSLMGMTQTQAQTSSYGCPKDATIGPGVNHNAQNPTEPGTIGGCGTGAYKLDQFKKHQKQLQDQQLMIGPKATGSGENL